jgi:hypothetical protein
VRVGSVERMEPALPARHTDQEAIRRVTPVQLAQLLAALRRSRRRGSVSREWSASSCSLTTTTALGGVRVAGRGVVILRGVGWQIVQTVPEKSRAISHASLLRNFGGIGTNRLTRF